MLGGAASLNKQLFRLSERRMNLSVLFVPLCITQNIKQFLHMECCTHPSAERIFIVGVK